jgi:YHS domain-containing protein
MMNKPPKIISRYGAIVVLCTTALLLAAQTVVASEKVNTTFFGVAIKGYDTVAYHTEGRALKGSSKISHKWNDAKWYFVSEANRDLFIKEPDRYAPQYGGY